MHLKKNTASKSIYYMNIVCNCDLLIFYNILVRNILLMLSVFQFVEEFNEKVEIVTDNLKTIVIESVSSNHVGNYK